MSGVCSTVDMQHRVKGSRHGDGDHPLPRSSQILNEGPCWQNRGYELCEIGFEDGTWSTDAVCDINGLVAIAKAKTEVGNVQLYSRIICNLKRERGPRAYSRGSSIVLYASSLRGFAAFLTKLWFWSWEGSPSRRARVPTCVVYFSSLLSVGGVC